MDATLQLPGMAAPAASMFGFKYAAVNHAPLLKNAANLVSGGIAAGVMVLTTYPADTVKTRLQAGTHCFRDIR